MYQLKEFDLTDYINTLEDFKSNQVETVVQHWGCVENFDMFIQKIKDDEENVAKLSIPYFGSIVKYTEEMKYNLSAFHHVLSQKNPIYRLFFISSEHFSKLMNKGQNEEVKKSPLNQIYCTAN